MCGMGQFYTVQWIYFFNKALFFPQTSGHFVQSKENPEMYTGLFIVSHFIYLKEMTAKSSHNRKLMTTINHSYLFHAVPSLFLKNVLSVCMRVKAKQESGPL